jgi:predicted DNA-binding transcriptional regulator YafY
MPITKSQIARYRIIDECFQNTNHQPSSSPNPNFRGIWPIVDLMDAIFKKLDSDISDRTLKTDLERMRDDIDLAYYAPIANKKGIGYYYTNKNFKLSERPLSPAAVRSLEDVIELLHQFKGFKYFEGVEGLIYNIEEKINHSDFIDVQFDVLPDYRGLEFIEEIKKAIKEKVVLKMNYKAFYEEADAPRHIHPYLLKEYNNRWFVYAYTNEYKDEGVYGLDRIKWLEKTDKKYKPLGNSGKPRIINYFKDIIGVTNFADKSVEDIVLKVKRERANYLITKPIHKSQCIIKESEGYIWFGFRLKPNNELNAIILSFGKDMIVETPAVLVSEIKLLMEEAVRNYE